MNRTDRFLGVLAIGIVTALFTSTGSAAVSGITVSAVTITSDNSSFCPTTLTAAFQVNVTVPGTYFYRHMRSDGTLDANVRTIVFSQPGHFALPNIPGSNVPFTMTFNAPAEGFVAVHFDATAAGDGVHFFPPDGAVGNFKVTCIQHSEIIVQSFKVSTAPADIQSFNNNVCVVTSKLLLTLLNKGPSNYNPAQAVTYQIHCEPMKSCFNNQSSNGVPVPALTAGASTVISIPPSPASLQFSCPPGGNSAATDGHFRATATNCTGGNASCESPADTENLVSTILPIAKMKGLCPSSCP